MSVAYTLKRLVAPQALTTSSTSYYQVPAATVTVVKQILVANSSSSAATFTLNIVPSGSTAQSSNQIFPAVPIQPNATITLDITQALNTGDQIYALASASGSVNVMISGYEAA